MDGFREIKRRSKLNINNVTISRNISVAYTITMTDARDTIYLWYNFYNGTRTSKCHVAYSNPTRGLVTPQPSEPAV